MGGCMYGRLTRWFRAHPWILTAFFCGAVLGLVLRMPVIPYQLPESTANILGAALGALAAVWGAAWIADHKERDQRDKAVRAIAITVHPVIAEALAFENALVTASQQSMTAPRTKRFDKLHHAMDVWKALQLSIEDMNERLDSMKPLFLQLGGDGVLAQGRLSLFGPGIEAFVGELQWAAYYDNQEQLERDLERLKTNLQTAIRQANNALRLIGV